MKLIQLWWTGQGWVKLIFSGKCLHISNLTVAAHLSLTWSDTPDYNSIRSIVLFWLECVNCIFLQTALVFISDLELSFYDWPERMQSSASDAGVLTAINLDFFGQAAVFEKLCMNETYRIPCHLSIYLPYFVPVGSSLSDWKPGHCFLSAGPSFTDKSNHSCRRLEFLISETAQASWLWQKLCFSHFPLFPHFSHFCHYLNQFCHRGYSKLAPGFSADELTY